MTRALKKEKQKNFSLINLTKNVIMLMFLLGIIIKIMPRFDQTQIKQIQKQILPLIYTTQPLVMEGGDPYIRALMRTISASEANFFNPYHVIYTGKYVEDLSKHPNVCVTIIRGPNQGKCTTAAGRYQFLNKTWAEKASKYHPKPSGVLAWQHYSFEPEYQDKVIYNWLKDSQAWGVDISQLLKEEKIDQVLKLLSSTWTSLGYGIEDNSMSEYLPKIYHKTLAEELNQKASK